MTQPRGALADAPSPATGPRRARPSWPPASRSRAGCPSATTASRMRHLSNSSYTRSCCARRTGAATTSKANAPRRPARCSSAAASTTPLSHLLPPHARARRHARPRPGQRRLPRPLARTSSPTSTPSAASAGRPSSTSPPRSRSAWTRSTLTFAELVPRLGRPVAVQRKLEFALAPRLEWTVQCYLDLETLRDSDEHPEPVARGRRLQGQEQPASRRPRPTSTRRPACTSPAAGSKASPRATSRSRRSPSPASGASR